MMIYTASADHCLPFTFLHRTRTELFAGCIPIGAQCEDGMRINLRSELNANRATVTNKLYSALFLTTTATT